MATGLSSAALPKHILSNCVQVTASSEVLGECHGAYSVEQNDGVCSERPYSLALQKNMRIYLKIRTVDFVETLYLHSKSTNIHSHSFFKFKRTA